MAVNKISLNTIEATTVSTFHLPYIGESVNADILRHLGTNLGTTSFSPPNTVTVLITNEAGTISAGTIDQLINRNSDQVEWSTSTATIQLEFLSNYEIDISTYELRYGNSVTSNYWNSWILEGSNDTIIWTELDHRANIGAPPGNFDYVPFSCSNRFGFFKYLRWRVLDIVGNGGMAEIFLYGKLRNLVTGNAGTKGAIGTMNNYPDIDAANTNLAGRLFVYDGVTWNLKPNVPWVVKKEVLTGDLTITSGYEPTFYIISPNGANREIILPDPPTEKDTIRIKNLDGAFDLTVKENPSDPTPVVLNNAGKLQYEFVYDGVEWQVTG